ncbi:hypothetical protein F4861DRAFT_359375 [Xylaria intraflava]|nr:hypothetical protein F4861DRAFT_359375 [Xylaria intraflava]
MSHQLLIAAAIGKQYREVATAYHSGHAVPGADGPVPLRFQSFDATDTMARAFRDWANREKRNRFRSQSHTPETVIAESRTTGPEDTPSASRVSNDGSFTDDSDDNDDGGAGLAGGTGRSATQRYGMAFRAISSTFGLDDDGDDDDDDDDDDEDDDDGDDTDLVNLDSKDVSDEIMATAYDLLSTATSDQRGHHDWADMFADDILGGLARWDPLISSHLSGGVSSTHSNNESSGGHKSKIPLGGKQGFEESANFGNNLPRGVKTALDFLQYLKQRAPDEARVTGHPVPRSDHNTHGNNKGLSERNPNKLTAPDPDIYNPSRWLVNTQDANDGEWVCKEAERRGHKNPRDQMETGFVTWDEQEARFPCLDTRLHLHDVSGPYPVIFDPATVDSQVWDPLNRMVVESKIGMRTPLRLNPITTHSLARWTPLHFGIEYPLDPIRLPDQPMTEDKRRPLPSATLTMPHAMRRKMDDGPKGIVSTGNRSVRKKATFAPTAKMAVLSEEMPSQLAIQEIHVASVHYPLKSPSATSISRPSLKKYDNDGQSANAATRAIAKYRPRSPPTPYPRLAMPATPTVALYEHPASTTPESTSSHPASPMFESGISYPARSPSEEDQSLAAFFPNAKASAAQFPSSATALMAQATPIHSQDDSKKRVAEPSNSPAKRRRMSILEIDISSSGSDSGKENGTTFSFHAPSPMRTPSTAAVTPRWIADVEGRSSSGDSDPEDMDTESESESEAEADVRERSASPESHATTVETLDEGQAAEDVTSPAPPTHGSQPHSAKSVRFDLREGASAVMQRHARRAIGRYNRTIERQGPLGPFGPAGSDVEVE